MIDWVSIVRASRRRFSYRGRPGQRREKRRRKLTPQYYDDDACCICCFAAAPDKECEVGAAVPRSRGLAVLRSCNGGGDEAMKGDVTGLSGAAVELFLVWLYYVSTGYAP